MSEILTLFLSFFKIGLVTFGGGYAMIPLIKEEVLSHGWLTSAELIDFIGISESTPGPFAVNIATFIGFSKAGIAGAAAATFGVVLPSLVIILIIAKFLSGYQEDRRVKAFMSGLRPAVIGSLFASAALLFVSVFFTGAKLTNMTGVIILMMIIILKTLKKDLHPVFLILASGLAGILIGIY